MKVLRLILLGALLVPAIALRSVPAQVYSPRRLTERIAPQTAPSPRPMAPPAAAPPVVMVVQPTVDPVKARADLEEAQRKAVEFQKQRAAEDAQAAQDQPNAKVLNGGTPPVTVECQPVHPRPEESVYDLDLSLRNTSSKGISRLKMRLVYYDAAGAKLKEWVTQRDLEPTLPPNRTLELSQPAFFMPMTTTRTAKVLVEGVRFADGTEWTR
jgi:hypothetical protein